VAVAAGAAAGVAEPTTPHEDRSSGAYLEAVAWLTQQRRDGRPRDPSVAAALLQALGAPPPPRALHVVGTNGKGTVTHLLAAMAQAAGVRVGRFTSPHVEDLRERVAVAGVAVSPDEVIAFVRRARALAPPGVGFFEWTLGLAVDAFARGGVELAVVEAGVGARHDATMALPGVIGTVLTNVDLDHVETLGPTILDIARDKAAVARPGVPLVTAARGEALALLLRTAHEVGAPAWAIDAEHPLGRWPAGAPAPDRHWPPTRIEDARLALALGRILGWPEAALADGLASPPPPGRFERFAVAVDGHPVEVILDGAHDPAAAARLAAALPAGYVLVFGSLARKRALDTLTPLRERARSVWLTSAEAGEEPPEWPVGVPHEAPTTSAPVVRVASLPEALERACASAALDGATVVVAGSLHLAGHARPWLRSRNVAPRDAGAMLTGRWDASGSSA
jgi:dihydrofolate synthase / folylpolyglutamate synthase